MKRISRREKGSIFLKLVFSYFIFAMIALLIIFVGGFCILTYAGGGDMNKLVPSQLVSEDGTLDDLQIVYEMNGWVEKLDESYKVIEVFGEKKTVEYQYTASELLEKTRPDKMNVKYLFFYESFQGGSYLFCYPKENLNITFTYNLVGITTNGQQVMIVLWLFLLLLADGLLLSLYIYRKIRMPLKKLVNGMKRMEKGEREFCLTFQADGEFIVLREAFNRMLKHVQKEEVEKVTLQEERHQMLLEVSHDLKSPIATINNCAYALKEGVVTEQERDKFYQMIAAKTRRVGELADDMFTMLKMESNIYEPDFVEMDFYEFARRFCAEYYDELEQDGFEVDIEIPETQVFIKGDEKLLHRAIGNLLSNVMKYNQTGRYIKIKALQKDEKVNLVVADNGLPIEGELFSKLFSAFVRGKEVQKTSSGAGLGLAIAKAVILKHNGDIYYQYEGEKNEFVIVLNKLN